MVPEYMAGKENDTERLAMAFQIAEMASPALSRLFRGVRFYKVLAPSEPPAPPYAMAVVGKQRCIMPGGFNRLLVETRREITSQNVIDMAKAFVILTAASFEPTQGDPLLYFPSVVFGFGKKMTGEYGGTGGASLDVRIGGRNENWDLGAKFGQFSAVIRINANGKEPAKYYDPGNALPPWK